jgi:hypothetical protein
MREEITAISPAEPVTRQEKKDPASERRRPAPDSSPEPPAAHPHKGRLLDVIA